MFVTEDWKNSDKIISDAVQKVTIMIILSLDPNSGSNESMTEMLHFIQHDKKRSLSLLLSTVRLKILNVCKGSKNQHISKLINSVIGSVVKESIL